MFSQKTTCQAQKKFKYYASEILVPNHLPKIHDLISQTKSNQEEPRLLDKAIMLLFPN